jgi:hypothetical protein
MYIIFWLIVTAVRMLDMTYLNQVGMQIRRRSFGGTSGTITTTLLPHETSIIHVYTVMGPVPEENPLRWKYKGRYRELVVTGTGGTEENRGLLLEPMAVLVGGSRDFEFP